MDAEKPRNWLAWLLLIAVILSLVGLARFGRDAWEYRSGGGPMAYRDGYEWAQKHRVRDANRCPSAPRKFTRGCEDYVEEQLGQ